MKKALIVIDLQNDYFPDGNFPLWNTDVTLENTLCAIKTAVSKDVPVILIQHVADKNKGTSSFFNEGTQGVEIHPDVLAVAPSAIIVQKSFADSFYHTKLEEELSRSGAEELFICGMMTQNCVTHTAISKSAEKYKVTILPDCCTTVSEVVHQIALSAISIRVELLPSTELNHRL